MLNPLQICGLTNLKGYYSASESSSINVINVNNPKVISWQDLKGDGDNLNQNDSILQPMYNIEEQKIVFEHSILTKINALKPGNGHSSVKTFIIGGKYSNVGGIFQLANVMPSGNTFPSNISIDIDGRLVLKGLQGQVRMVDSIPAESEFFAIFQYNQNFDSTRLRINGVDIALTTNTPSLKLTWDTRGIFNYYLGTDNNSSFVGEIRAFLLWGGGSAALSLAQQQKLEGWYKHTFNLPNILPTDHPYYSNAPE